MYNTTTYTSFRHQQDISVGDASATTLFSFFLLRMIQWITTSAITEFIGKMVIIFTLLGIAATLLTPSTTTKQKGLNGAHYIPSKKYV